jgi:hypothetical protein
MDRSARGWLGLVLLAGACGGEGKNPFDGPTTGSTSDAEGSGVSMSTTSQPGADTTAATGSSGDGDDGPTLFDLEQTDVGPFRPEPSCEVVDDMDGVGDCSQTAPPESFEPDVQWSWDGASGTAVTPLVINFTDDDANGQIDLCDTPDVIVVAGGRIHVLDGETGTENLEIPSPVHGFVTPAVGDIDGDGRPEVVTAVATGLFDLAFVAFEDDGTLKWTSDSVWPHDQGGAVGLADFDNDGSPEIYGDGAIVDAAGNTVFVAPPQTGWLLAGRSTATVAADLDDDGDLELVLGQAAYHHDGTLVWNDPTIQPGYPQIANLDNDPEPEVLVNNAGGITILEHDGTVKYQDMKPTGDVGLGAWFRPATVHDFDSDGISELAVSSAASYSVYFRNLTIMWTAPVQDGSGWAAGTAFDFLGDGGAEAMYADEANLFVFDDMGTPLLTVPRSSKTLIEYPVVADVDNDGSAEIVVVSAPDWDEVQTSPTVQVIRDAEDRWIQARRIWNQHTYHVTNVREDGHIPQYEQPSWQLLNTYRTNAQIENGGVCAPPPVG